MLMTEEIQGTTPSFIIRPYSVLPNTPLWPYIRLDGRHVFGPAILDRVVKHTLWVTSLSLRSDHSFLSMVFLDPIFTLYCTAFDMWLISFRA